MKIKLNKILLITSTVLAVLILILAVLGSINRVGYLSEFKLNKDLSKKNEHHYDFRIKYYSKIFRNSDLYGVYFEIPKSVNVNDASVVLKNIKIDKVGSPFGTFISSKELKYDDKINYINYKLKLKLPVWIVFVICVIYLLYNYKLILYIFNENKQLVLKISKISSVSILSLLVLLFILGKLNHKANLTDLELIGESKAGYIYKARVDFKGLFSPNLIYKHLNESLKFANKSDDIKYGYNLELNTHPWRSSKDFIAFINNSYEGFIVSNSNSDYSQGGYSYNLELTKGEKYIVTLEAKKLSETIGGVILYQLASGRFINMSNTDNMTDDYKKYTSELEIKKEDIGEKPTVRFRFPKGVINIKYIKIDQVSENLYLKSGNSIVFTSSKKIDNLLDFGEINYQLFFNKISLTIIVLLILLIISRYINIIEPISKLYRLICKLFYKDDNIVIVKSSYNKCNIANILFIIYIILLSIIVLSITIMLIPHFDTLALTTYHNVFYNIYDFSSYKWQRGRHTLGIFMALNMRPFGNIFISLFNTDPLKTFMISKGVFSLIYLYLAVLPTSFFLWILNNKKNYKIIFIILSLYIVNYTTLYDYMPFSAYIPEYGLAMLIFFPMLYYFVYEKELLLFNNKKYHYILLIILLYFATFSNEPTSTMISGLSFFIILYIVVSRNTTIFYFKYDGINVRILFMLISTIILTIISFLLTLFGGRGRMQLERVENNDILSSIIKAYNSLAMFNKIIFVLCIIFLICIISKFIINKKISKKEYIYFSMSFTSIFLIFCYWSVKVISIWGLMLLSFSLLLVILLNTMNSSIKMLSTISTFIVFLLIFTMSITVLNDYDEKMRVNKDNIKILETLVEMYQYANDNDLKEVVIDREMAKKISYRLWESQSSDDYYNMKVSEFMRRYYINKHIPLVIKD